MAAPTTTTDPKVDLDALIKNAEDILAEVIKEESEKLAKAKDESSPESPEGSADGAPAPDADFSAPADGSTPTDAPSDAPPDASASPAPDAPPADGAPATPDAAAADPAADAGAVDPTQLKAEYAKLDDSTLEMHYMACKEAVYERVQATQGASPAAGASPTPSPSAPAPAASPTPAPSPSAPPTPGLTQDPTQPGPTMKNEKPVKGAPLTKSEDAQKIERLEDGLNKALRAIEILSTPMRKSLTGLDYQPKPGTSDQKSLRKAEQMSKSEITAVLTARAADPKLSKKDRDLINQWCLVGTSTKEIEHLLNDQK